jgi:hypothetical protein
MVAGAVLVMLGFIGFALQKNDVATAEGHLTRDTSSETVQAALAAISFRLIPKKLLERDE